jgi:hypothetical protein
MTLAQSRCLVRCHGATIALTAIWTLRRTALSSVSPFEHKTGKCDVTAELVTSNGRNTHPSIASCTWREADVSPLYLPLYYRFRWPDDRDELSGTACTGGDCVRRCVLHLAEKRFTLSLFNGGERYLTVLKVTKLNFQKCSRYS